MSFPRPLEPLVTPGVLVESFESGVPISEYVYGKEGGDNAGKGSTSTSASPSSSSAASAADKRRDAVAASLGRLGLGCYLQMLLRDNFVVSAERERGATEVPILIFPTSFSVLFLSIIFLTRVFFLSHSLFFSFKKNRQHADLHPGNILVRDGGKQQQPQQQQKTGDISSLPPPLTFFSRAAAALGLPPPPPHLVLLDVGMAAELAPRDQRSLLRFFKALALRDGRGVGGAVLDFATAASLPASPEAAEPFLSELGALFDSLTAEEVRERTPEVFGKVLSAVREHGVAIRADVSSVVASALVLEGWSSALDPDIRILEKVKAALPLTLRERLERWGDQMVAAPALF